MHGNVPVRFGRGRLASLGNKGLAAYLIAGHFGLRAEDDGTGAGTARAELLGPPTTQFTCGAGL
jgi:hypothetical protein